MTEEQAEQLEEVIDQKAVLHADSLLASGVEPMKVRRFLEDHYSPEVCRGILDCLTTRSHFAHKFEDAGRWLLHRQPAEQATASFIARWRADYLGERLNSGGRLAELGTGIGGDTVYLCRHFHVSGFEKVPARARLARANLCRLSPEALPWTITSEEVRASDLSGETLFVDPARRREQRQFDPEGWDPPLSSLTALEGFTNVIIKAAPGLDLDLLPDGWEVHFLSMAGNLKEAMLFSAPKAPELQGPLRHAWLFDPATRTVSHRSGSPGKAPLRKPAVGDFLHTPDPSVLRSDLLGDLADELEAGVVHEKIGYLCGPTPCPLPWATSFQILERLPLAWKSLASALMARDWSDVEILTRGVPFAQAEILHRLRKVRKVWAKRAGPRGTLILYRDEQGYTAILAERLPHESFSRTQRTH